MTHYQKTAVGVVFIVVIALCATFLVGEWTRGFGRLDLTESKLYTLSDGSKRIVDGLQKPLTMKFFYSKEAIDRQGQDRLREIHTYYHYVRSLLEAFERYGGGKLELQEYDPRAYSRAEEEADRLQIRRLGSLGDDGIYFGLAVTSPAGAEPVVEFFDPSRQAQIEYQIAEAIELATKPTRKRLGVLSSLDITGGGMSDMMRQMMAMQGRPVSEPWGAIEALRRFYEIEDVAADTDTIDPTLDYLLIVHPKDLGEETLYAIDQFVMNGGALVVFTDPYAPIADPPQRDPSNPFAGAQQDSSSDLNRLLEAYGARTTSAVVGDPVLALEVPDRRRRAQTLVTFLGLNRPAPDGDGMLGIAEDEVIVQGLPEEVWLFYSGAVERSDAAPDGIEFAPLLHTTDKGGSFELDRAALMAPGGPDPQQINRQFAPGVQPVTLAARLTGTFRSAFPEGAPKPATDEETEDGSETEEETEGETESEEQQEEAETHLAESREPTSIVVCADVDMIADSFAYDTRFQGLAIPMNANGTFLANAIDFLAGSTDLMSVRSRGHFDRSFTEVEKIEREAERETAEKVARINEEIERYDSELQAQAARYNEENASLVKGEVLDKRRELEREVRAKRRELNQVQQERNEEIEGLGEWLRLLNVVLWPAVVLLAGVGVWWWRHRLRTIAKGGVA